MKKLMLQLFVILDLAVKAIVPEKVQHDVSMKINFSS